MTKGTFWVIGILLLVFMVVGARWVYEGSAKAGTNKNDAAGNDSQPMVISWGHFDVEKGVAFLYPRQYGNVVYLHDESEKSKDGAAVEVKEGELLLQVDDALAKLKVEEAKADVDAGEQQFKEAQKLPQLYKLQQETQQSAIKSAQSEIERFDLELKSKLDPLDPSSALAKIYRDLAKTGADQLNEKKNVEEKKLAQIKLQDAQLKIEQAKADLDARKVRLKEAEEMLKYYKIVAPSDGYVLRVHVRKGETLGPNPRSAAIEFLPKAPIIVRAEVLQEWGRFVKPGKEVVIEDDTYKGPVWNGVVKRISGWYAPVRSPIIEPFRFNDVRTLECIIEVKSGDSPKLIGQRVRAKIKIDTQ
jgi:biotin carboxyl carrier protein